MSQPTSVTPPPTQAPHPFNQPSADIILCTSNNVEFRVHSFILALTSQVFADMLSLPQPSDPRDGDGAGATSPPVIPITEDSAVLELLLRIVYPIRKPKLDDPRTMVPALKAATKYEMELALDVMSDKLSADIKHGRFALEVWAAACRTDLEDVARRAAEALRESGGYVSADQEALLRMDDLGDMAGISAADYFRLRRFLSPERSPGTRDLPLLSGSPPEGKGSPSSSKRAKAKVSRRSTAPFSTDLPNTDVACRCASGTGTPTMFRAHQTVLAIHSPVLAARLADLRSRDPPPVGPDSSGGSDFVLELDESPEVVSALLNTCYTLGSDLPSSLDSLAKQLLAARKYGMTRVERWTRDTWDRRMVLSPLEAYCVAVNHDLEECALAAARELIRNPVADTYEPVMETTPALAYHRLLTARDSFIEKARNRLAEACKEVPERAYVDGQSVDLSAYKNALRDIKVREQGVLKNGLDLPIGKAMEKIAFPVPVLSRHSDVRKPTWQEVWPTFNRHITKIPEDIYREAGKAWVC